MPSLTGVRVIRGPDWKWKDQDGGIGNVGTIIKTPEVDLNRIVPGTVTVVWDSGYKGQYRAGPKGCYDLRIVDNSATGVKHKNIPCDGAHCSKKEICGMLWQCATCRINICTSCFIKEIPHDKSHRKFNRLDGSRNTDQTTTSYCWSGETGPESRIPLLGIYPGAKVVQRTYCSTAQKDANKMGSVLPDTDRHNILVKWFPSKEKSRYPRIDDNGNVALRAIELGTGGFLDPDAFPLLEIVLPADENQQLESPPSVFSIGDWVKIDPRIHLEKLRTMQVDHGEFKEEMEMLLRVAGRVESLTDSSVIVRFKRLKLNLSFNPVVLKKLNELSINQTICIKETAIREIGTQLGQLKEDKNFEQLKKAVGRVTEIHPEDPLKVYVQFDNDEIHNWLPKNIPFPSSCLEKYEGNHPDLEAELVEVISKNVTLFFKAVDRGDLRIAKLLHIRHGVDVDALNADGKTALQLASEKGHINIVEWLLNETKVDIEKLSLNGFRAIHYAVKGFEPKILEMLINKGAQINSQTELGRTAVHLAVGGYQSQENLRLLIHSGCDVNIQDSEGYTPLHYALHFDTSVDIIKILVDSGKINWKLCTKKGRNILHTLICDASIHDLKLLQLILLNEDSDLVFKWNDQDATFLHYACSSQNIELAKLLLDIQRERDRRLSPDTTTSASPSLPSDCHQLKKLLEAPCNKIGDTALLMSCYHVDYAMIELLIEAGADMTCTNLGGNTAIHMLAACLRKEKIPSKELFPCIAQYMDLTKKEPALSLVAYLIDKGCQWNVVNKYREKASDVLLRKGLFSNSSIEILNQFARKKETIASGGLYCMGRFDCFQPPVHQLSCPHKVSFKACFKCFPLCYNKQKCGCVDEDFVSLPGVKIEIEPPAEEPKQPLGKRKLKADENSGSQKPPLVKRERITM